MASAHWFAATVLVAALASPAFGQTPTASSSPLRDAVAREATWLTAQPAKTLPATAQWSRVKKLLAPAEEIRIVLLEGPALPRLFLAADEDTVTVLNDSNPVIPEETRRELRGMAATSSRTLATIPKGNRLRVNRFRLDASGAYLGDCRIANASSIVEIHRRDDVREIALAQWNPSKPLWRYLLGWPGALGFSAGALAGHICAETRGCSVSNRTLVIIGAGGSLAAAILAREIDKDAPDGTVYRRPD